MVLTGNPTPPVDPPVPVVTPAAPTPPAQELIRLRDLVDATFHPSSGPPPGTIPPPANRLDGMRQMLADMMTEQQELATAHTLHLLARHERDLAYQARQTALLEAQRSRVALIGTTQTRTTNIARELDMLEVILMDQLVVFEMSGRAIDPPLPVLDPPFASGSPVPLAPPRLWIDSDDGQRCKKHHEN